MGSTHSSSSSSTIAAASNNNNHIRTVNGLERIQTWAAISSSTIQGNSSLTMAKEWVVKAAVATTSTNSTKANTPEEDTTILVVVADLLTVEGEKVVAVVAAVDEVAFLISPSSPTRRSCQRVQSI